MRRLLLSLTIPSLLLWALGGIAQQTFTANASVPNLIRYGGALKDGLGAPAAPATTGVTFALYQQQEGGVPIWMETQNVTTDASGQYSVLLGSTTATGLPSDLFSQQEQRWLGVQAQGKAEQPRVLLVSVPYAFKAHEAETLGGRSVSDFVLANSANSSANPGNTSQAESSAATDSSLTTAVAESLTQEPTRFSGSTSDQIVRVIQSGTGAGVNATASGNAVLGAATAATGLSYGVYGSTASTEGYGILGNASAATGGSVGVKGRAVSTSGTGVRGIEVATTGNTAGISSYVASPDGTAAVFDNAAGGKIISGRRNGVQMFSVDGSGNVNSSGRFAGSGSGLTDLQFSQIGGLLQSTQFSGSYNDAVTLRNTANVFYGDGSHLTGIGGGGGGKYILNGTSQQPDANFNISGMGAASTFNSATGYQIGGHAVLSIGSDSTSVYLGLGAGNSFSDAQMNTFAGFDAGAHSTGGNNSFYGNSAGSGNTEGSYNSFYGNFSGSSNTSGFANAFYGDESGESNTSGQFNAFYGTQSGINTTKGVFNSFFGTRAGMNNTSGSSNVYVANEGPDAGDEKHTIRIGTQGAGDGQQVFTYIAGIYGSASGSGIPVYINSDGKLGTLTSSLHFKEQVRDMGDSTSALMKLHPVTFLYKPEYDKGERTLQYGLIAEEVAKVYPELVAYDNDGQPYTDRYQYIATMLLNEVQKQYHRADAQTAVIKAQQQKIDDLEQRLSRLERLIPQNVAQK